MKQLINSDSMLAFEENTDNVLNILEASDRSSRFNKDTLYITVKVPITQNIKSELFKAIKVPILRGNEMAMMTHVSPYLAKCKKYVYMGYSAEQIAECTETMKSILCRYPRHTANPPCENEIIAVNTVKHCKFEKIPLENYLVKIRENRFYSVTIKPYQVHFKTYNQTEQTLNISTNEFLNINTDGVLKVENQTYHINTHCKLEICGTQMNFLLPNLELPFSRNLTENNISEFKYMSIIVNDFDVPYKNLKELSNNLVKENGKFGMFLETSQYYLMVIMIILIALVILKCLWKCVY